jgi:primase-polymerase (primpol)-like protein
MVVTTKLALLMHGEIVNRSPFTVNMQGNSIEYPSHSEADMALVTLLAMKHNGDAGLIDADFRESSLYRAKWEREDYRNGTIQKAIRTAKQ